MQTLPGHTHCARLVIITCALSMTMSGHEEIATRDLWERTLVVARTAATVADEARTRSERLVVGGPFSFTFTQYEHKLSTGVRITRFMITSS